MESERKKNERTRGEERENKKSSRIGENNSSKKFRVKKPAVRRYEERIEKGGKEKSRREEDRTKRGKYILEVV